MGLESQAQVRSDQGEDVVHLETRLTGETQIQDLIIALSYKPSEQHVLYYTRVCTSNTSIN
ncbi:MAG: hypothetical protein ACFFGZ_05935 [Candidatus Thorarchaeota archaeon]